CATPTGILQTRDVRQIHSHRRRHRCPGCGHRFTTYEFIFDDPLCVELDEMETPRGPVSGFFVLLPFSRTLKAALERQRKAAEAVKRAVERD
ncbi:MAG: hypothetical protein VKI63_04220, partial [Cyanobium sp.]|nr:hypothetical protein [Cyanobium sp.]